jgi:hypothetical protein
MLLRFLILVAILSMARVADAQFVNDTFTDTAGDLVTSAHTGETGATWTKSTATGYTGGDLLITDENRARQNNGGATLLYSSGTAATAEYDVTCVITVKTVIAGGNTGCGARVATNAETGYFVIYEVANTQWEFWEIIAGTYTSLGNCEANPLGAGDYTITLSIRDALKTASITGCTLISHSATNDITAAGRVAIISANHSNSNSTGLHIASISASNPVAATVKNLMLLGVGP